ncbi:UV-endonuclease UvdE-domain-containing protein [Schizophyllum amplum]|uniref:UV-endonuclease UvdE-domain-containing protein n=1 Tax=Schizophyllum amplum TaxID=97359 RepID=A0A550CZC0_9AGAR|nr:UV-endonuclease UvdE-domain-containing protein [Auriculariopsis ampla]
MSKRKLTVVATSPSPPPPLKKKRKTAAKRPVTYEIAPVPSLTTTYRGRLGYACLNTVLRHQAPASSAVFCSRTCRIATLAKEGIAFAKNLGLQNARDLITLIKWNAQHGIRFMRVSSDMFPFASHPVWGYDLAYANDVLAEAGNLANSLGHRLTTHPGQFTQLGSPNDKVIQASIRELTYHAEMLDRMRQGPDAVMIIHGGGVYGDKHAALARIRNSITTRLPAHVRARLVLENDELCYSAADLLPLCEELDVPLVFDYHHHDINPGYISAPTPPNDNEAASADTAADTSPRPGALTIPERRAHADRVARLPEVIWDDVDLMIEAKDKEQAVLQLYRTYGLAGVDGLGAVDGGE